jgi:signal transduction histidine kinase
MLLSFLFFRIHLVLASNSVMNTASQLSTPVDDAGTTDGTMVEVVCADLPCATVGGLIAEDDQRRLKLAQSLHRDISGGLVVCNTFSEMARMGCEQGEDLASIKESIVKLEASLKLVIQVSREITEDQYPLGLKAFGLVFALDKLARKMTGAGTAEVSLTVEGNEFGLPLEQRLSVYRILEGLAGRCVRVGAASMVSIHCSFSASELEFLLLHDGEDSVSTAERDDAELAWIKARIAVLPGRLQISCADPDGASSLRLLMPAPAKP